MIVIRSAGLIWLLSLLSIVISTTFGGQLGAPPLMVRSYHEEANYYTWIDPRTAVFQESLSYPLRTYISPDGQWLLWEDKPHSQARMSIFIAPFTEPENRRLLLEYDQAGFRLYQPQVIWLSSSQEFIVIEPPYTNSEQLWVTPLQQVNILTGEKVFIGECTILGEYALLSPDERYLLMTYLHANTLGIVDMQTGSCHLIKNVTTLIQIGQIVEANVMPIWSSDGRYLYYTTHYGNALATLVLNAYDTANGSSQVVDLLSRPDTLFPSNSYLTYSSYRGILNMIGDDDHYELNVGRLSAAAWTADDRYFAYAVEDLHSTVAASSIYIFEPESGATWKIGQVRGAAREIKWMED